MARRAVLAATAIIAALVVGGISGALVTSPSRGATTPPVVSFQPTIGWNTVQTNVATDPNALPVAWAANVPFQPEDKSGSGFPDATLRNLPSDGIVVVAVGPWEYTGSDQLPNLTLPLELSSLRFQSNEYEGQPAPNVSRYWVSGFVNDSEVANVFVWFGSNQPTQDMLDAANKELVELAIPS